MIEVPKHKKIGMVSGELWLVVSFDLISYKTLFVDMHSQFSWQGVLWSALSDLSSLFKKIKCTNVDLVWIEVYWL